MPRAVAPVIRDAARWRARKAKLAVRHFPIRLRAWRAFRRNVSAYRVLDEAHLRATRKSDTVFIFGSGASLNAISPEDWQAIEGYDTIGFNWFVRQSFVRCDYHLIREIVDKDLDGSWRAAFPEYFRLVRDQPKYAETIFLVQTGFRATSGNLAIGHRFIPLANRIFLWRTLDRALPSGSIAEGLSHGHGTLNECINFAALMGWRHIVLAGVDLYDRSYFWLRPGETLPRDTTVATPHRTAGIIQGIGAWRDIFNREGINLYAYNPLSLLVPTLPVWRW